LEEGCGDLIAAGIIVTPERQQRLDFTSPLATVQQVIVTGANTPNLKSLDDVRGQRVIANPLTVYCETLKRLSESFVRAGKPAIDLKASDPNLTEEDLLEMANAGLIRITAANGYSRGVLGLGVEK
jgi:ABC-type amino acid transport substrate-binding protein